MDDQKGHLKEFFLYLTPSPNIFKVFSTHSHIWPKNSAIKANKSSRHPIAGQGRTESLSQKCISIRLSSQSYTRTSFPFDFPEKKNLKMNEL